LPSPQKERCSLEKTSGGGEASAAAHRTTGRDTNQRTVKRGVSVKEFKDRVAVVTGAASGIGRAMADRFAAEGMKVVLADIEREALARTEGEMKAKGATVLAVRTDVSKAADVEALARKTTDAFGAVHVVCNNAGVVVGGMSWERTVADWEWGLGVNLWGVLHGIRVFVPIMLGQGTEGHIVNTASMAGLVSVPLMSVYNVTKHAIVTLSEAMHHELKLAGGKVKVSVLCPGWFNTQLMDSDRNRPPELLNKADQEVDSPATEAFQQAVRQLVITGLTAEHVADHVLNAIREEKLYILTHPDMKEGIRTRMEDILAERNPVFDPAALAPGAGGGE
jgi:NAD(P)-dependent dehydrogenase (short-subunit alcohol dehydrogenase family)